MSKISAAWAAVKAWVAPKWVAVKAWVKARSLEATTKWGFILAALIAAAHAAAGLADKWAYLIFGATFLQIIKADSPPKLKPVDPPVPPKTGS